MTMENMFFIEVKGGGGGLRHSQLKWFRDFQQLNAEIWFTDSNEHITQKMDSENLETYSLAKPRSKTEDSWCGVLKSGKVFERSDTW